MACFKKIVSEYRNFRANIIVNRQVRNKPLKVHTSQFRAFMHQLQLSLGYGQIFRLPSALHQHKGGPFFLAYGICLIIITSGIACMEKYVGQYCSKSPITAFSMIPAAKGIGYSLFIQGFFLMAYYTQITSIAIYYFLKSFSDPLPWESCYIYYDKEDDIHCIESNQTCPHGKNCEYPELFHWNYVVKQPYRAINPNYGYLGRLQPDLVLCSIAAWVAVSISMSYQPNHKAMYFSIFSTISMLLVLGFAMMKDNYGAAGMTQLYLPNFNEIVDYRIWISAVKECMYVAGTGMITSVTMGRAGHFTSHIHIDCAVIAFVNFFISLLTGSIVFAVIGVLTYQRKLEFFEVPSGNFAVTFLIFPMALQRLPYASLFTILFFFLFIDLGVTHSAAFGRSIGDCISEIWPTIGNYQILVNFCIALIGFIIGLPILCRGGLFYFDIFDKIAIGAILIFMSAIEALVVTQIYGLGLFCEDIVFMTDRYPRRIYRYIWGLGGYILLAVFVADTINSHMYHWKPWSQWLALALSVCLISPVFIVGIYVVIMERKKTGSWSSFQPNPQYGPATRYLRDKRREFSIPRKIF